MMEFGCDDYLITPITPVSFWRPWQPVVSCKKSSEDGNGNTQHAAAPEKTYAQKPAAEGESPLARLSIPSVILDAFVHSPQDPIGTSLGKLIPCCRPCSMSS